MANALRPAPWWDGDEVCSHCCTRYHYVSERRCASCDGPTCPHCVTVVRETREVVCRGCELESQSEKQEQ